MEMRQTLETAAELTLEQRQRLEAILATYQELKVDAELLNEQIELEKQKAYDLLKEAGIDKTELNGIKLTEVGGETSKFDKQLFVKLGGDITIYNSAFRKKPKKKYLKITIGEEKEAGEE